MVDGWISGLLRRFYLLRTNFWQAKQGAGGWDGGEGWGGRWLRFLTSCLEYQSSQKGPILHHKAKEASSYHWSRCLTDLAFNRGNHFQGD